MSRLGWVLLCALGSVSWLSGPQAHASATSVLPAGFAMVDGSYAWTLTDRQFGADRTSLPLLRGIARYEPGGGLQGTLTARPEVDVRLAIGQLQLGLTDRLTLGIGLPVVTRARIATHLGWTPGDWQPQLGRRYSETDFWAWAKSMGQDRPQDFDGLHGVPADMVVGVRYRLPDRSGFESALTVQGALPTGAAKDPERLVAIGSTTWDLQDYADLELHLAVERPWPTQGVPRLRLGLEAVAGWYRPRTLQTPRGLDAPLLTTFAPYVGDTYRVDPGDFAGLVAMVEAVPWVGPSTPNWLVRDPERARRLPPTLTVQVAVQQLRTQALVVSSHNALWDWQQARDFGPGEKNTVRLGADLNLLRLGLPLIVYTQWRAQTWLPGRNFRATDSLFVGVRLLVKCW